MSKEVDLLPVKKNDFLSSHEAVQKFAGYFELLDQIDKRLQKEDPEYKKIYYPDERNHEN